VRAKVSPRAAEGYKFEVRFRTTYKWRKNKTEVMQEILDIVRSSFGKYKITKNGKKVHRTHYTVYLGSESDLLMLRMADRENLVFRVYSLSEKRLTD
jgi:hypothetical protein